jgi:phenylacetaldehyde dehydrogenase
MSTATVEIPTHHLVKTFVSAPRKMLIGGKWLEATSGKTFPTYNPATGEVLAHVAEGASADVDSAVTAARNTFERGPWRTLTASERGRLIWKLADLLESHLEEFAQLESLDNGKPIAERVQTGSATLEYKSRTPICYI